MYTLTQTQQTIHKDLLWSTGMLLNTGRSYMGKEPQKEYMSMYMYIYIYGLVPQSWSLSRLGWTGVIYGVLWTLCQLPPPPTGLAVPGPSARVHTLQAQEGPPNDTPSLGHPKDGGRSGPRPHVCAATPTSTFPPQVTHLHMTAAFTGGSPGVGICLGDKG